MCEDMLEPVNTNMMETSTFIKKEIFEDYDVNGGVGLTIASNLEANTSRPIEKDIFKDYDINDGVTVASNMYEDTLELVNTNLMEVSTPIKKEIVVSGEMAEETCYFCGYPVQLQPGQSTVECGLCSEILTFDQPDINKITCPFCKNIIQRYLGVGPNRCEVCAEILNGDPCVTEENAFTCDVCGKRLSSWRRLRKHTKKHAAPRLDCKYCPQLFTRNSDRRTHERKHQSHLKSLVCDICGIKFFSQQLFTWHITTHSTEAVRVSHIYRRPNGKTSSSRPNGKTSLSHMSDENLPYSCRFCGMTIQTQEYLVQHIGEHRKNFPNRCFRCGLVFADFEHLEEHTCNSTSEGVNIKRSLLAPRLKTYEDKVSHECASCGLVFTDLKLLEKHVCYASSEGMNTCTSKSEIAPKVSIYTYENVDLASQKCANCGMVFLGFQKLLENHVCSNLNSNTNGSEPDPYSMVHAPGKTITDASERSLIPSESENSKSLLLDRDLNVTPSNAPRKISSRLRIRLSSRERSAVRYHVNNGMSAKEVAEMLNVSENVVNNICKIRQNYDDTDLLESIAKLVHSDRFLTLPRIKAIHGGTNSAPRLLNELGYDITVSVPGLNEDLRSRRLAWAMRHLKWTEEDWDRVLWTGTVKYRRFATLPPYNKDISKWSREHIWRLPHEDSREKVIQSSSTGEESIHIWGCMSSKGFGKLIRISGSFDAASYLTILQDSMLPSAFALIGPDFVMQHDNNSKQAEDLRVQKWLWAQNLEAQKWLGSLSPKGVDLKVMEWPGGCTDLNPLEAVWNRLCPELDGYDSDDLDELFMKIDTLIKNISTSFYENEIGKMINRCAALVMASGGYINCT